MLHVENVLDLPVLVPGLIAQPSGGNNQFLRGVGSASTGFNEAQNAVYIDGLYLANPAVGITSFNNLERIEVLKGPQGTLYGRNVTGGLISVITKDPAFEPHADMSVGYGNYDTASAGATEQDGRSAHRDLVLDRADAFDLAAHHVAGLEEHRRLHLYPDPLGGVGGDEVARLDREIAATSRFRPLLGLLLRRPGDLAPPGNLAWRKVVQPCPRALDRLLGLGGRDSEAAQDHRRDALDISPGAFPGDQPLDRLDLGTHQYVAGNLDRRHVVVTRLDA